MTTDIVMVQEFPDLARTYAVASVPLTVVEPLEDGAGLVGQGTSVLGAQGEAAFVSAVTEVGGIAESNGNRGS